MVLVKCTFQSYEDLHHPEMYQRMSRAKLTERNTNLHHQKNELEQRIADHRALASDIEVQEAAEEEQLLQAQAYVARLAERLHQTKYRKQQNAGELERMIPQLTDVDAHLGDTEWMQAICLQSNVLG
jgi:chromosome segregation ATPase